MKLKQHAWAFALTIGPLAAWLAWSIQRGRKVHAFFAGFANGLLWIGGPAFVMKVFG
jgi:hypothetical protein